MPNISGYYTYTTQEGDTFDLLALDMYDDEKNGTLHHSGKSGLLRHDCFPWWRRIAAPNHIQRRTQRHGRTMEAIGWLRK